MKSILILFFTIQAALATQTIVTTTFPAISIQMDPGTPQSVITKLKLLQHVFEKYSLLYPESIKADTYGGNLIALSISDKVIKLFQELRRLGKSYYMDFPWYGYAVRSQIPRGLEKYCELSKKILRGSETLEIYHIIEIPGVEHIVKALGFRKTISSDNNISLTHRTFGYKPEQNITTVQRVIIPDIDSLRARILEINRMIRKSRTQVKGHKRPPNYHIALDIYASGKQVVGEKYIRNFAERRALPIAALDRHPIIAEHDYSAHLQELLTITPELGEAFQSLLQDGIKLINFLKRNYPGALDSLTREPKLTGNPKSFETGEEVLIAQCLNSLFKEMGRVLDSDLLKVKLRTEDEVATLKYNEVLEGVVNEQIHSVIELSFHEIINYFFVNNGNNSVVAKILDSFEFDASKGTTLIKKFMSDFYEENQDLKDKKYLPEGKVFVDYFADAYDQIQYLNEFLEKNPL